MIEDIKQKTDLELTQAVKNNNCEESLKELISRHTPICFSVFNRYKTKIMESGAMISPEFHEKDLIIYNTAKSYDPTFNAKYSSWLHNNLRYTLLDSLKDTKDIAVESEVLEQLQEHEDKINPKKDPNFYLTLSYINNIIRQLKDERTKKILNLRYFHHKKLTWAKIAKRVKLTPQMAIALHNKAIQLIRKKLNSNTISDNI